MLMINDFATDLSRSHEQANDPCWEMIYREAWSDFVAMEYIDDLEEQKGERDRRVFLKGGRVIIVEEKNRQKPKFRQKPWCDIAIEYVHEYPSGRQVPGWIEKLSADYLAYNNLGTEVCYLIPVPQLKCAREELEDYWFDCAEGEELGFSIFAAHNGGYNSWNIGIPPEELIRAIEHYGGRVIVVKWGEKHEVT